MKSPGTTADKDLGAVVSELDAFEKYVTQFGVKTLNERNNSPQEYCRLYRKRYLPAENSNLALGARIVWIDAPAEKYRASGEKTLTDGLSAAHRSSRAGRAGRARTAPSSSIWAAT